MAKIMFQKLMNQEYFQKDNDMKNTKIKNMFTKIFMMLPLISISMTANAFQTAPTPTLNSNTEIGQNGSNIDKNGKATSAKKSDSGGDDRVIKQVTLELVEDESCVECSAVPVVLPEGFPAYAFIAIGGAALAPFIVNGFVNSSPTGSRFVVSPS